MYVPGAPDMISSSVAPAAAGRNRAVSSAGLSVPSCAEVEKPAQLTIVAVLTVAATAVSTRPNTGRVLRYNIEGCEKRGRTYGGRRGSFSVRRI